MFIFQRFSKKRPRVLIDFQILLSLAQECRCFSGAFSTLFSDLPTYMLECARLD